MKTLKLLLLLCLLCTIPVAAQRKILAVCQNPSGQFIPLAADLLGQIYTGSLPQEVIYGSGTDGQYHALQCDADGNLINGGGSGSMTWPSAAGIAVYGGSQSWGSSLTAPVGALVGTSDTQTLTNKTIDGVSPTTFGFLDPTSSVQTQLNGKTNTTILSNSAPAAGKIPIGDGTGYAPQSFAQDATVDSAGNVTVAGLGGVALSTFNGLLKVTNGAASTAVAGSDYATPGQVSAPVGYSPNQSLTGCGVEYISGLTYQVGACTYTINGMTYTSPLTPETLTADATNDRIDIIGVDNTGSVIVLVGTPSSNPQAPTIDPSTQLELTFVYIPANASAPTNTTLVNIFDEGTEWTQTYTAHLALSTVNPYRNTKDIEATAAVLNNSVFLQNGTTIDPANYNNLVFYIRSKATWPTGTSGATAARTLSIYWANGTTQKGQQVVLRTGQFGFNSSNTTTYQQISIPLSSFGANGNAVNRLYFVVSGSSGSSSIGFYLDAISLQGGSGNVPALPSTLMNWRGVYNTTTAYNTNDVVVQNDVPYIALTANTNNPLTGASWQNLGLGTFINDTITCSGTGCTLNHSPLTFATLSRNGIVQRTTDFSRNGTAVTLSVAATSGDVFTAQYFY